eukprot:4896257-Pleurochrysis_carterae.AAC.4
MSRRLASSTLSANPRAGAASDELPKLNRSCDRRYSWRVPDAGLRVAAMDDKGCTRISRLVWSGDIAAAEEALRKHENRMNKRLFLLLSAHAAFVRALVTGDERAADEATILLFLEMLEGSRPSTQAVTCARGQLALVFFLHSAVEVVCGRGTREQRSHDTACRGSVLGAPHAMTFVARARTRPGRVREAVRIGALLVVGRVGGLAPLVEEGERDSRGRARPAGALHADALHDARRAAAPHGCGAGDARGVQALLVDRRACRGGRSDPRVWRRLPWGAALAAAKVHREDPRSRRLQRVD